MDEAYDKISCCLNNNTQNGEGGMRVNDLITRTRLFSALSIASVIIAYVLLLNDGLDSAFMLTLPLSYLLLGMLIKYGDQAYDVGCFDKRKALVLAVPCGLWLGYMMINDPSTATIGVGMLLGLLAAGKYDNRGFIVGFVISITIAAIGYWEGSLQLALGGLAVVFVATIADERVNDMERVEMRLTLLDRILYQRPLLKIAVLALCAFGVFPSFAYLFMMLSFDFGYGLVDCVSTEREGCC